jgi:hypothetical protein
MNMTAARLIDQLYMTGYPFEGYPFAPNRVSKDPLWEPYYGETFETMVAMTNPEVIIEVGSWEGKSTMKFRKLAPTASIICIDTWLGGPEMWDPQARASHMYEKLQLRHTRPDVFHTFMCNLLWEEAIDPNEMQHMVCPIHQTSVGAFRILESEDVKANLIYIDGSHEYEEVLWDLKNYWKLLNPGGILFGDDWFDENVREAVDDFSTYVNMDPTVWKEWVFYSFMKESE